MAKIVELIEAWKKRGEGTHDDPVRRVRQFWTKDGDLLFELDPEDHTYTGDDFGHEQ